MQSFELIERGSQLNSYLLFISLLSLAFIAYARLSTPNALSLSWRRFLKTSRVESFGFDDEKMRPQTQALFFINFYLSLNLCVYLFVAEFYARTEALLMSTIVVAAWVLYQTLVYRFVLFLVDQWKWVAAFAEVNKQVWSFTGLIFLALAFLWTINGQANDLINNLFILCSLLLYFWRIFKSWRIAQQANLEWYYLILYLCALEILPMLLVWRWFIS
ncbi:MAG: hypothetical protein RLZZ321_2055 [Bacteroidota bacterium]|jgi:Domain of unknown function (DUF4271)